MRKLFTVAALAVSLALVGSAMTAAPAHAGNHKHQHKHRGHHHHYYWGVGGLFTGFALGYALNAYAQPEVRYVPVAPTYYTPYPPAPPYYLVPAAPAPAYAPTGVVIVP
jgi:hypothetical protein